ncbi:phosphoribosylamine--glycine ligase [Polymorphobacter fuscus]|uniref:Phosphoribosylamine--glycine ligase n=1 Tax=Sandarakinorhabdus fusca TaxID=1439888 RepID=A0A7C9KNC6_9SPHN|nr:phosphoribosylamine--glycine ligase [Polymorphobacter fuscus]KAB7644508.1 phosphoribosylamine--glycine ligase [Polymorphobacter fuscus]MQT18423.1 phosphoribosylamine--glycine ligase [Polymorphobacter fuscus]
MDILVLGGGGREHALCWKLHQSPRAGRIVCAPGNAGIAQVAECIDLAIADPGAVTDYARDHDIGLVVVGPEGPLVAGVVDALRSAGIPVFGPTAAAARLEGSKGFTKDLARAAGIPGAGYRRFASAADAHHYVAVHPLPVVIKADGLASGKGVTIAETNEEGLAALADINGPVVIEQCLEGPEASLFVLTDGKTVSIWPSAQDHKRAFDDDTGPNTGGMGVISPAPALTDALLSQAVAQIIKPTLKALSDAGTPYTGVLYAGLMLTASGPKLIEYNCRFGDPEAQALMLRLDSDLVELLLACAEGRLHDVTARWSPETAVAVVYAAMGYPGTPVSGTVIDNIDGAEALGVQVFHAGTRRNASGTLVAAGGRVLTIAALGADIGEARSLAYAAIRKIRWHGGFYRRDIGKR